jgi:hypothetical protein
VVEISEPKRWSVGAQILQQNLMLGRLTSARPETVVRDDAEYLILYTHPNAPYRSTHLINRYSLSVEERIERMLDFDSWQLEDRRSGDHHLISISRPDVWYSVWMIWSVDWEFRSWYVNFQSPYHRTDSGIIVEDLALDLRVNPDLSWSWKDDDEFVEMVRQGVITVEQATAVKTVKTEVIELIEQKHAPFDSGWTDWRPLKEWPVPKIPGESGHI